MQDKFIQEKYLIVLISKIPKFIRSNDFRSLFDTLIQESAFLCFHYRHRRFSPDFKAKYRLEIDSDPDTNAAFLIVQKTQLETVSSLIKSLNISGKTLKIQTINEFVNKLSSEISENFWALEEFHPPSYLPNGNVGTPSKIIHDMISQCKIPTSVLKSLKVSPKPIFASVPFDYSTLDTKAFLPALKEGEDWERHIQFHNDVDNQGRTQPRLYESEKEIVWEKGSSGLVFYTDDQYWHYTEGKVDFDEDTVDDWDVDVGIYTDPSIADRDAVELLQMREIEAAKRGVNILTYDKKKLKNNGKARALDKSNFGAKTLQKYGWKKGQAIGKRGLVEPLEEVFRKPYDKSGLGFTKTPTTNYICKKPKKLDLIKF